MNVKYSFKYCKYSFKSLSTVKKNLHCFYFITLAKKLLKNQFRRIWNLWKIFCQIYQEIMKVWKIITTIEKLSQYIIGKDLLTWLVKLFYFKNSRLSNHLNKTLCDQGFTGSFFKKKCIKIIVTKTFLEKLWYNFIQDIDNGTLKKLIP